MGAGMSGNEISGDQAESSDAAADVAAADVTQTPAPAPPAQPVPVSPRSPVALQPSEPGWWQATDGLWYPPERHPGVAAPAPGIVSPAAGSQNIIIQMAHASSPTAAGPPRSKAVAFLLAFLLGTLGVHRFYLGLTGSGVVMLLLSFTFIGLVVTVPWALIDCVLILTGGLRDREGRPLN